MPAKTFTGSPMMQVDHTVAQSRIGNRLGRLPFVLLLTVGLLLSLIHCAGCGPAFASPNMPTVAMNLDLGSGPDTPEQQLPCHGGHCLSHVDAQPAATVVTPADLIPRAPSFGQQQSPPALAGLPLFKPPRA
jgi:hypothetical protein